MCFLERVVETRNVTQREQTEGKWRYSIAHLISHPLLFRQGTGQILSRHSGYTLFRTEHPKLFIVQLRKGDSFGNKKPIAVENLDIFTYVNSKFIYVEKHLRSQLNQLYHDVLMQRCTLVQKVLKNALTIATQLPDEFAFNLIKGPGYMAVVAGEAVHIIKCIPIEIKLRKTEECYLQLPITRGNRSLFMSPRTHIVMKGGTQINCNPIIPSMYRLDESWY